MEGGAFFVGTETKEKTLIKAIRSPREFGWRFGKRRANSKELASF